MAELRTLRLKENPARKKRAGRKKRRSSRAVSPSRARRARRRSRRSHRTTRRAVFRGRRYLIEAMAMSAGKPVYGYWTGKQFDTTRTKARRYSSEKGAAREMRKLVKRARHQGAAGVIVLRVVPA